VPLRGHVQCAHFVAAWWELARYGIDGDAHCVRTQVDLTAKGVFVTDLGSSNGTFINNRKIKSNSPSKLQVGQTLTLADQVGPLSCHC
jgi:hypothetical protein